MAITATELTALYLSYFGRPPDQGGMNYYLAQPDATVQSVAAAFSASPESMDLIGLTFGPEQVDRIYMNLFGRHAEPDGLAYWTQQVADGLMTPAFAAYGIFLGAQNSDLLCVQNKMLVATTFLEHLDTAEELAGYAGNEAAQAAREYLDTVNANPASVNSALANLDAAIAAMLASGETGGPTYTFLGGTTIEEGWMVQMYVQTTGIAPGVVLDWSITGLDPEDWEGALTGTTTVGADGKVNVLLSPLVDNVDDTPETFTLSVGGGQLVMTLNEMSGPLFDSYLVNTTLKGNNHVFRNGADLGSADYTSKDSRDQLTVGGTTTVGALVDFKWVKLDDKADLTMSAATHAALTGAQQFAATGTQTVHLTDAFSGTLNLAIENYGLGNVSGNDATLSTAGQNVTGGSSDDIVRTGTFTSITGTLDGGSQSKIDSLYVTTTGTDLTGATITNFEAVNLDFDVNVTLTVALANALNLAVGTNTVTVKDAGTITGAADVEAYVLANLTGNDFTLASGTQTVTGSADQADIVRTGGVTTYSGTVNAGSGTDRFIVSPTGSDISGATLNGIDEIELDTDADATMTLAQHAILDTSDGDNTVTLTGADAITGKADVESYVLADATGNVFTLGASGQNVTGSDTQDDVVKTGSLTTVSGAINLGGHATADQLVIQTTADISGATLTGVEQINLESGVSATMKVAQNAFVNAGVDTNTITFSNSGTATGAAAIETYNLFSSSGNVFTLGASGQNVNGGTADDTIKTGAITSVTGKLDGGANTGKDLLSITTTGTDISTANIVNIEQIDLETDVAAKMTLAHHLLIGNATGTANVVTLSDAGILTGHAQVESYTLSGAGGNTFTLGTGAQNVTGQAGVNDVVKTNTFTTVSGNISLGTGNTDQLVIVTDGTNISTATLTDVEQVNLETDVSATMKIAQNALVTNALGTKNTITLSDAGTATGAGQVEAYVLSGTAANSFTLGSGSQKVTGQATANDTVNTGSFTSITSTIDLGAGGTDVLFITTTNTNISTATLTNIEQIHLNTDVAATMTIAYNALVTTALGTNTITLTDAGTATGAANVESYVLKDAAGNIFTLGANGQNVTGSASQSDVVKSGSNTNITGTINLGASTGDQFVVVTNDTKISGADLSTVEQILLNTDVDATMSISQNAKIFAADGDNTVTLSETGTATGSALVESYILDKNGTSNDFTLGAAQNVTGGSKDDILRTGGVTSLAGVTLDGGKESTADKLYVSTTGTDISGATLTSIEQLILDNDVNVTMKVAQHSLLTTATGKNTVTFADSGSFSANSQVEAYVLGGTGANTITLTSSSQSVTGSNTQNDTVNTGALTSLTGKIDLQGHSSADSIFVNTNNTDLSGATITNVEQINLNTDVDVKILIGQHSMLNTLTGDNTVTFSDAGTVTGKSGVETYILSGTAANNFTLGAAQNVTGQTGVDDIVETGSVTSLAIGTTGAAINLGAGGTDQLKVTGDANISAAILTSVEQINLGTNVDVTMTVAQHAFLNTVDTTNTVTLTTQATNLAGKAVGAYTLGNFSNSLILGSTSQNVTGGTGADIIKGSGTLTGNYNLGLGTDIIQLTAGSDITGATIDASVEQLGLDSGVTVTMKAAQHAMTINSGGSNTIKFSDAFSGTGKSNIATYVLGDVDGNSFTLGAANQTVQTTGTRNDTVNTGSFTTVTANIDFGAGTDTLVITTNNTHIEGATLSNLENITLNNNSAYMLIAQNAWITSATGTNTVNLTDAGTATGNSAVETYVLSTTGANTFTLGASQSVTGGDSVADTVKTGSVTTLGAVTINLGTGTGDKLLVEADASISAATLTSVEEINLATNVDITMTVAQHASLNTADSTNTVTFTTQATSGTTGKSGVSTYTLGNFTNTFTVGSTSQNVTGVGGADTVKAAGTLTGTYNLGGGVDALQLTGTANIVNAGIDASVEAVNLDSSVAVTMKAAQHALIGTAAGSNTVTFTDAASLTGNSAIASYVLADVTGNDFTLGASAQNVTGSANQDDIVRTGALTSVTGTLSGGGQTSADKLELTTDNTDISGATVSGFEEINLASGHSAKVNLSQHAKLNSLGGTNTITLSDAGTFTADADVEAYVLSGAGGNDITLTVAAQDVTGQDAADDTVRTGALTSITGDISLGAGGTDKLVIETNATDISGATLTGVEQVNLASGVSATMTTAQNANVNSAAGTNTITLSDAGTATGAAEVEAYVLFDGAGNDFTLGHADQDVTGSASEADVIHTGSAAAITGTLDGGASADDALAISKTNQDLSGATLTGFEFIDLDTDVSFTMSDAQHDILRNAAGTNTVTFSEAVNTTGNSQVESYVLSSAGGNEFHLGASQNVTGGDTVNDNVYTNGVTTFGGTLNLGDGGTDKFIIDNDADISGATLTKVEAVDLDSNVDVTLTVAQHDLLGATTGDNTVTFSEAVSTTANAGIEAYVLSGKGANDLTLSDVGQDVTGQAAANDTVRTAIAIVGTISLGTGGTDSVLVTADGTDISGATLVEVEQVNLAMNVDAKMTVDQAKLISSTVGDNTVTLTDAGTLTGAGSVDKYVLFNGSGNDFTLGSTVQNVDGSEDFDDIIRTGANTSFSNTISFGTTSTGDKLVVGASGLNITLGMTGLDIIDLETGVGVTMSLANQHGKIGTAAGTNTVTLGDAGTFTANSQVEFYVLSSAGANDITLTADQGVTGQAAVNDIVRADAVPTLTRAISLGTGGTDQLVISGNTDISGATLTGVDQVNLDTDADITLNASTQHSLLNTLTGDNTVTFSAAVTTFTGKAGVETYVLANGTNSFITASTSQKVTGGTGEDTVTIGGTVTGSYDLVSGTADTLTLSANTDLTGGSVANIDVLNMASKTISMLGAQNNVFSSVTSPGTITITDSATSVNALSGATAYVLSSTGDDTISFAGVATLNISAGGVDSVVYKNSTHDTGTSAAVTVTGFTTGSGGDVFKPFLGANAYSGTIVEGVASNQTISANQYSVLEIAATGAVTLTDVTGNGSGTVKAAVNTAIGNIGTGKYYVVLYAATSGTTTAGIYSLDVTGTSIGNANAVNVELIGLLNSVTSGSLTSANFG